MRLTKAQQKALFQKYQQSTVRDYTPDQYRNPIHYPSYLAMRRAVVPEFYGDSVMILWCGMWLGIETDGYTHS